MPSSSDFRPRQGGQASPGRAPWNSGPSVIPRSIACPRLPQSHQQLRVRSLRDTTHRSDRCGQPPVLAAFTACIVGSPGVPPQKEKTLPCECSFRNVRKTELTDDKQQFRPSLFAMSRARRVQRRNGPYMFRSRVVRTRRVAVRKRPVTAAALPSCFRCQRWPGKSAASCQQALPLPFISRQCPDITRSFARKRRTQCVLDLPNTIFALVAPGTPRSMRRSRSSTEEDRTAPSYPAMSRRTRWRRLADAQAKAAPWRGSIFVAAATSA